jgi:aminoglycoside phosphotransferase (APT) family kinase protein
MSSKNEQQINWDRVERYLKENILILSKSPIEITPYTAGYSNLTFLVGIGEWSAVLRRPPFGPIPKKAHDMEREYQILKNLHSVFPLAPKPYLYCENPEIMDKHFYIMEKKEGVVIDDSLPDSFEDNYRTRQLISDAAVNTLVHLHSIDYQGANLDNIGRAEGYLERQVNGWVQRYHTAKTDEIRGVDHIEKWLIENIPTSYKPTIVHNDFKLNNMMFAKGNPREVVGVFDWEMCTIGDPLTDLGAALAYWAEPGEPETGLISVTGNPGFYSRRDFLEMYAKRSGRDVSNVDYYISFAFYKIAVILQQIYYRWLSGNAKDDRFSKLGEGILNLMNLASDAQQQRILK